jgi:magnesium chelatase family protein
MEDLTLSARAYNKILKVSRTIADIAGSALGSVAEGSADIQAEHVNEAIEYRRLDTNLWT